MITRIRKKKMQSYEGPLTQSHLLFDLVTRIQGALNLIRHTRQTLPPLPAPRQVLC